MARGWRYTKHSLSSALLLFLFGMYLVIFILFAVFVFVVMLSLEI